MRLDELDFRTYPFTPPQILVHCCPTVGFGRSIDPNIILLDPNTFRPSPSSTLFLLLYFPFRRPSSPLQALEQQSCRGILLILDRTSSVCGINPFSNHESASYRNDSALRLGRSQNRDLPSTTVACIIGPKNLDDIATESAGSGLSPKIYATASSLRSAITCRESNNLFGEKLFGESTLRGFPHQVAGFCATSY